MALGVQTAKNGKVKENNMKIYIAGCLTNRDEDMYHKLNVERFGYYNRLVSFFFKEYWLKNVFAAVKKEKEDKQ